MRVVYIGADDAQVNWGGGDDPRECLAEGVAYELDGQEQHSWHTRFFLKDFPGKWFNSVCFAAAEELFCVRVNGPDDLIPAPSRADAERVAAALNRLAAGGHFGGLISADVEPWPYSAATHAEELKNPDPMFAAIDR